MRMTLGRLAAFPLAVLALAAVPSAVHAAAMTLTVTDPPVGFRALGAGPDGTLRFSGPYRLELTLTGTLTADDGSPADGSGFTIFEARSATDIQNHTSVTGSAGTFAQSATLYRSARWSAGAAPNSVIAAPVFSAPLDIFVYPTIRVSKGGTAKRRILFGQVSTLNASADGALQLERKAGKRYVKVKAVHVTRGGDWTTTVSKPKQGTYRLHYVSRHPLELLDGLSSTFKL
jgi:hypothetical protein